MSRTFMTAKIQGPEWFARWENRFGEGDCMPMGRVLPRPEGDGPRTIDASDYHELRDSVARDIGAEPEDVRELSLAWGYGVRASADGYMDATEWEVCETPEEAEDAYWRERESLDENDPEVIARAVSLIPARSLVTQRTYQLDAYRRLRQLGFGAAVAVSLCRGLEFLSALGDSARVDWQPDDMPAECACGAPRCEREHNGHQQWMCSVVVLDSDGADGNTESLGGIDFGRDGEPGGWYEHNGYGMVIEAELASQQLAWHTPKPMNLPPL